MSALAVWQPARRVVGVAVGPRRLQRALETAVREQAFTLAYQPKVDVATGAICGVEALARWHSDELGPVAPMRFIPALEKSGLIVAMGEWALRQAARDQRRWREQGLEPLRIAVNVSPVQLTAPGFGATLETLVRDEGAALELEITESVLMQDLDRAIPRLAAARALGIPIALDDFGTGYSSLSYLARLPVSTLKVDRSFTRDLLGDARLRALVTAVVALGRALGLRVVAEGVETEAQLRELARIGCNEVQGRVLAEPMSADHIAALLRRGGRMLADRGGHAPSGPAAEPAAGVETDRAQAGQSWQSVRFT